MNDNIARYFVGLDVSQKSTAICVIDNDGKIVHEGAARSRPDDIFGWIRNRMLVNDTIDISDIRIGLEAGSISAWLHGGLNQHGLQVVCLETFQAHRFLATFRNKTDKNDARGLAQLLRMGGEDFLKVVRLKSKGAQETRTLLASRDHLVKMKVSLENNISGSLKPYGGIVLRSATKAETFRERTLEVVRNLERDADVHLMSIIAPSLLLYEQLVKRIEAMTKSAEKLAGEIPMVKRFMEIPGVGPITALSFYCAVDNPGRFHKSTDVAAYFGLTPRQFQSGETDYTTGISKRGDMSVRRALVIAVTVLLTSTKGWCSLKAWGVRLAGRIGISKARIAVARKLAVIMHRMWINNDRWRPVAVPSEERRNLMRRMTSAQNKNGVYRVLEDCMITEDGEIIS